MLLTHESLQEEELQHCCNEGEKTVETSNALVGRTGVLKEIS